MTGSGLIDDRDKTLCAVTLINATGEEAKVLSELTTKKFHLNDFIIGLHLLAQNMNFAHERAVQLNNFKTTTDSSILSLTWLTQ